MPRNLLTALAIALVGLSAGSWFLTPATGERELRHCARRIEKDFKERQQMAETILARLDTLIPLLTNLQKAGSDQSGPSPLPNLPAFPDGMSFQLFARDSLLFWSDRKVSIPGPYLDRLRQEKGPILADLSTGIYLLYSRPGSQLSDPLLWVTALPVKEDFRVTSPALLPEFYAGRAIPPELTLEAAPPGAVIRDRDDHPILYLRGAVEQSSRWRKIAGLIALLLGLTGIFRVMEITALRIAGGHSPGGVLVLFSAIGAGAWLLVRRQVNNAFTVPALPGGTLADYSASVLLLLGMVLFIFKNFPKEERSPASVPARWYRAAAGYALITMAFTGTFWYLRTMVSGVDPFFDLNALFPLKVHSLIALFAIIVLEFSILLFGWWLLGKVSRYRLNPHLRLSALLGGVLAGMIPSTVVDLDLPLWAIFLTTLVFIALLDLLVDFRIQGLTPIVIWLVLLSAFTAALLFKYQLDEDWQRQQGYAHQLAQRRLPAVEEALQRWAGHLREDELLQRQLAGTSDRHALYRQIDRHWLREESLYRGFEYKLSRQPPFPEDSVPDAADSLGNGLWHLPPDRYLQQLEGTLWISVDPMVSGEGKILPALFPSGIQELPAAYDFAVYWQGRLLKGRGQPGQELLRQPLPAAGESRRLLTSERAELIFHDQQGTVVLLSRFLGGYGRPLSLFSFVFICLLIAAVCFLLVDRQYQALPITLHTFPFLSLRNRIQLAVLALIIGSFLLVGWVTASFFTRSTTEYRAEQIRGLLSTLQRELQQEATLAPEGMVERLAGIHRRDFDLFDVDGKLLASSARLVYQLELAAPRMDIRALERLRSGRDEWIILPGRLGQLSLQTAYLRTGLSGPAAFLGLPLVAPARNARQDLYEFLATLINVYVFLLLLASAVALAVANSITRPLERVGAKLSDLQLESNEPIDWNSPDEIGRLIAAYNRMIGKLAESTEKLRQSEREGAWREMAKQVAHEIKNPLTPMKLSIQHLHRAFRVDPENARPLLERVAATLIEQIDGLAHIATSFSNFARMPTPQNRQFSLTELTRSVYDLYCQRQSDQLHLALELPDGDLRVFADRDQILRVINNLLENAIQAIPKDHPGFIHIGLTASGDDTVRLYVQDNGSGIPAEVQPKVFYPNFTTKSSGMGLGLAMCKQIIETANGKIAFETAPGAGTTFFFELPLVG